MPPTAPSTGKIAEKALDQVHITVNKNTIPFDTQKPFVASGIRLGTPALTTRGMKEGEMKLIGEMIAAIIREPESEDVKAKVKRDVALAHWSRTREQVEDSVVGEREPAPPSAAHDRHPQAAHQLRHGGDEGRLEAIVRRGAVVRLSDMVYCHASTVA